MSQYNHFAKDLDTAFKEAREKYTAAYNAVEQARKAMQDAGTDAMKKQIVTLQLQDAETNLRKEAVRIWAEFDAKAADLRRALEKEVQTSNLADPSAIDNNALELMKTGILTVDDYFGFADRYDKNPTMLKLIGHYAKEAADNADSTKDRVPGFLSAIRFLRPRLCMPAARESRCPRIRMDGRINPLSGFWNGRNTPAAPVTSRPTPSPTS